MEEFPSDLEQWETALLSRHKLSAELQPGTRRAPSSDPRMESLHRVSFSCKL